MQTEPNRWTDDGRVSRWGLNPLIGQDLWCGGDREWLNSFQLKRCNEDGTLNPLGPFLRYSYQCCESLAVKIDTERYKETPTFRTSSLHSLQFDIHCRYGEALKGFSYNFQGLRPATAELMYIKYTCIGLKTEGPTPRNSEPGMQNVNPNPWLKRTTPLEKEGDVVVFLDRHSVSCDSTNFLNRCLLTGAGNRINFESYCFSPLLITAQATSLPALAPSASLVPSPSSAWNLMPTVIAAALVILILA